MKITLLFKSRMIEVCMKALYINIIKRFDKTVLEIIVRSLCRFVYIE